MHNATRVDRRRDPAFCGAERAAWWELVPLALHAHPSVAAMTRTLLAGTTVVYEGDPLRSLTLGAFLDKFVQKKPKVSPPALRHLPDGESYHLA